VIWKSEADGVIENKSENGADFPFIGTVGNLALEKQ
jgi:hypothetical protein